MDVSGLLGPYPVNTDGPLHPSGSGSAGAKALLMAFTAQRMLGRPVWHGTAWH